MPQTPITSTPLPGDPRSLAVRFQAAAEAINTRHEAGLEELLALYDSEIEFQDPMVTVRGIANFAALNRKLLSWSRTARWEITQTSQEGGQFFAAWTLTVVSKVGWPITFEGVTQARTRADKIVWQRDHWDILNTALSFLPSVRSALRSLSGKLISS